MSATGDWRRLGSMVKRRRESLGLNQGAPGTPSKATWYKVENAIDPPYRSATLHALERALGWMPNSVQRILEGGEPEEVWVPGQDVTNLKEFPNSHEFERAETTVYEQLLARVEKEAAALREELAAEREERERLAGRVDELAKRRRRRKANPEPEPVELPEWVNAGDEDEVEMWGLRNLSEETREELIYEVRRRKAHVDRAVEPPDLN